MHRGSVRGRSRGARTRGELRALGRPRRGGRPGSAPPGTVATFLTQSVDDLNEDLNTGLEYVSAAGIHKTIDTWEDQRFVPEPVLTYDVGASLELPHVRASLHYWNYDFESGSRPSRREGGASRRGSSARHPEVGSGAPSPPDQAQLCTWPWAHDAVPRVARQSWTTSPPASAGSPVSARERGDGRSTAITARYG